MFNQLYPENCISKINGLSIDSRRIEPNDIFIPIKGGKFDGHNFIDSVLKVDNTICFNQNKKIDHNRVINIKSSKNMLIDLASAWRDQMDSNIIAITGSNGKTTTKELLYHVLKDTFTCSKSSGNHNSTIGLPLTFLNCKLSDTYTILELGANKPGEIKTLCKTIKPNFSLITNISNTHIKNFKSLDEIKNTKSEIFKNLDKDGIAFVNINDKSIRQISLKNKKITFGINNLEADYNGILNSKSHLKINTFELKIPQDINHLNESILAVYTIANTLGVSNKNFQKAINSFTIPEGRGSTLNIKGYTIIDDAYNASPASMKLGIERFSKLKTKGNKILIIGDMLELGDQKIKEHKKIGQLINEQNIDVVLTFGDATNHAFNELNNHYIYKKHFNDMNSLKNKFNTIVKKDDLIFIKGSRYMQLERLYK